jgi:hypothetical protein
MCSYFKIHLKMCSLSLILKQKPQRLSVGIVQTQPNRIGMYIHSNSKTQRTLFYHKSLKILFENEWILFLCRIR